MEFETMRSLLDANSESGKKIRLALNQYAFDGVLLPILPIAIKQGLSGRIETNEFNGTIEEIIYKHFCDTSSDVITAQSRMNEFLVKMK